MRQLFTQLQGVAALLTLIPAVSAQHTQQWVGISEPSRRVVIASEEVGRIIESPVREGQAIKAGDLLFRLDARVLEARVQRLRLLAESDALVREARYKLDQAKRGAERARDLLRRDIASQTGADEAELELQIALVALDRAILNAALAWVDLEEAEHRLARFSVMSLMDGVVEERFAQVGETVEPLTPVLAVIHLDTLWIEFDCRLEDLHNFAIGSKVHVRPIHDSPGEGVRSIRSGTIIHVSVTADAASQSRRVRVATANQNHLWHPGYKMLITLPSHPAAPK